MIILSLLATASYAYNNILQAALKPAFDLRVLYDAARTFREGGSPYASGDFLYHILVAILLSPLTLLPFHLAKLVWLLVNHAAVVLLFIYGVHLLPSFSEGRKPQMWLIVCLGISSPLTYAFQLGALDISVLALIVVAIYHARDSRPISAGALLALAILIKPWAAFPFLGWLCVDLIAACWAASFTVFGFGFLALIYTRETTDFLATLFSVGSKGSDYIDNLSVSGFIRKVATPLSVGDSIPPEWFLTRAGAYQAANWGYYFALVISLAFLIGVFLFACVHYRQHLRQHPEWAAWIFLTLIPIVFPVAWPHWLIVLILPLAAVLTLLEGIKSSKWTFYVTGVSLYLITSHDSYLIYWFVPLISPLLWGMRLFGTVILLGMLFYALHHSYRMTAAADSTPR